MALNLFGAFDEKKDQVKMMIICSTIISFMEFCIDEKAEPTIDKMIVYIKDKTGIAIDSELAQQFLNILAGNIKVFIMFMINEQCEKIADDMLDKDSTIWGYIKKTIF